MQTKIERKSKLDELQETEQEDHRKLWNKRRELVRGWFELDSKLDGYVRDITEKEEDDGDNPSS